MQLVETLSTLSPILCPIPVAAGMIGRTERVIYSLIGAGKIKAVKSDGRTLVVVESLHDYAASLPPAQIAPEAKRQPARIRDKVKHVP
jgi:hypothetical protein